MPKKNTKAFWEDCPHLKEQIDPENPPSVWKLTKGSHKKIMWKKECEPGVIHKWISSVNKRCERGQDCPENECIQKKRRERCFEKTGFEHHMQREDVKEKCRLTTLKHFGVPNSMQSPEVREKAKLTVMEHYNVEHQMHSPEVREKVKLTTMKRYNVENSLQSPEVREKAKITIMERYNVENPMQSPEIREKARLTNMERYNVGMSLQSPEIREKAKLTILNTYGTDHAMKADVTKKKLKQTNLNRYKVENVMQDPTISQRSLQNSFKSKSYMLPSGEEIRVQGYEPFCLDFLFAKGYDEEDVFTKRIDVPEIWYEFEGQQHRYYADIWIPSKNLLIEVKSEWSFKSKFESNKKKFLASQEQGYNIQIWIFDRKGYRTHKIKEM